MSDDRLLAGCEPASTGSGTYGALVLHGFTGCPQAVRPLADTFAAAGFAVEMPLLPGHGTTVEDMLTTTWSDWAGAAEDAYGRLADRCDRAVVAGLSMGGTLAVRLATRHPQIAGIVCINPLVHLADDIVDMAGKMLEKGQDRIPSITGDIADPDARETGYDVTPLEPLLSLGTGTEALRSELDRVTCPVLLMTSTQDHVVPPSNSDALAGAVSGPVERTALERSYHVATLDHDRHLLGAAAVAFARRVCAAAG